MRNWVRRILMCVVCSVLAVSVYSVPAYRGWLTMEQPDGSTIQVRQVGDEFYHYMVNEAGQRIKQNADGYYVVAGEVPTPEVAEARRAASMARKNIRRAPKAVGTEPNLAPKGVVILVNFKDDAMQSGHTRAVFDELCNSTNCTVNKYNNKNYGSAAQYFADQSNGNYRPQFDVYGPVTLSRNVAYYGTDKDTGDPDEDEGDDQHATDAVVEACILANQQYSDLNFANYDSDSDGYVDFVYVIYAGKGQADGGAATTIWPHNWEVESAIAYGYCTYTKAQCQIDGKKLNNYAMSGELSGSSLGGIGTLCHEFGHVMGLPDLYDTKYGTNYDNHVTPGDWNIMDGGSYNGDGHCPPNYDPWQKYFFGWVTPVNLATEGQNITLLPNGTEGYQSYQINSANKLQTATTAGVNYYIENRQKQGWDAFIPTSGMLVWKINFNASAWSNNTPNNTAGSPKYTIVPADGKTSDYGAAGDTYPYGSSVRSYTPISGHEITEITKSGSNITFKYNGGQQKTECSYELLGEHCTYPADGVVAYNAALSLTITPAAGYTLADPSCWTVEMGTNNELVYGEGFTYNAGTNEFRIEHVTDDVAIIVEGKEQVTLTWMANGVQFAQTITAGSVVLPENEPEGCDGKVFVGWCATENYNSASVAPTFVKTGDEANQTTYYAVFATKGEGGNNWSLVSDASTLKVGDVLVIACSSKSVTAGNISSEIMSPVSSTFSNGTISSLGSGTVELTLGGSKDAWTLTSSSGQLGATAVKKLAWNGGTTTWSINISNDNATIANTQNSYGKFLYNNSSPRFTTYSSDPSTNMLLPQLYRKGGSSYSDYTTSCTPVEPCALTGITLNTDNTKKSFKTGEVFGYSGLVVTANYSNCADKIVTPTSVSTPDMSTAGSKTVTVSYTENEVTKNASYQVTVTDPAKYTIRFYNNGKLVGTEQSVTEGQQPEVPSDPSVCEGYTFVGWWTETLGAENTEEKNWITDFTATKNQDYYAIYSKTEKGEGESEIANMTFKVYSEDGTKEYTTTSSDIISSVSGVSSFTGSKLYKGTKGVKMGSKSASGYFTLTLTASASIKKVIVNAAQYNTDTGKLQVKIGDLDMDSQSPASNLVFESESPIETDQITVSTTSKRAYVSSVSVYAGGGSTTYYTSTVSCTPTDVETEVVRAQKAQKVLMNGQMVIIRDGKMYNIMGHAIR